MQTPDEDPPADRLLVAVDRPMQTDDLERALLELATSGFADLSEESAEISKDIESEVVPQLRRSRFRLWSW